MHIGSKIRISIILLQDISISSGTDVNTADAWWQNTAPRSAVGYSRPYYVSESAEVEPPERGSEIPLLTGEPEGHDKDAEGCRDNGGEVYSHDVHSAAHDK